MRSAISFLLAAPLLFLIACDPARRAATSQRITLDTMAVTGTNNPQDSYRGSATRIWDILYTRVALTFNYEEKTAGGRAWIDLKPYARDTNEVVLDAKGMQIDTVARMLGPRLVQLPFKYADDRLHIRLPAYNTGIETDTDQLLHLYIRYKALPYADSVAGGSRAIIEDRGLYFINTDRSIPGKPVQIWTQGETESNSHWLPTIDKPNERFTVQVELTVPDSFQTLGNGTRVQSSAAGGGLRTDTWRMDQPIQTYAIMFAIGHFSITKDSWEGREVSYYLEPDYTPHARAIFRHTPEMIAFFSRATGVPYPWNKYSQVVVRDYVSGAMENTSASLFGEFANQTSREIADVNYEDVVSHELFHQWFGDYVTAESWSNLTVNESFANYGEQLWRRYFYGSNRADELAYEDLTKYLAGTGDKDPSLVRFHYTDKEDMFDRISYEKGGAILRYINGLIGDELFGKAMKLYLTHNALQPAEATHWRLALEEATGQDWNWFFNEFYYRGGHPKLDIRYTYDDAARQLRVTVRQQAQPDSSYRYRLPLQAALINGRERTIVDWNIGRRTETFVYPYQRNVRPVIVPDCFHWLPGEIIEDKAPEAWLTQLRNTADYSSKRRALNGVFPRLQDTASLQAFTYALNDTVSSIRVHALKLLTAVERASYREQLTRQVAYLSTQDGTNAVRAAAFSVLGAWKVTGSRDDMSAALSDSSYAVAGSALESLALLDAAAGYKKAKEILPTTPRGRLESAVWSSIAAKGEPADIRVFEEKANSVYGTRKISFAGYLARYMSVVRDSAAFYKGADIFEQLYRTENITSYRKAIVGQVFGVGDGLATQIKKARGKADKEDLSRRRDAMRLRLLPLVSGLKDKAMWEGYINQSFGG